MSINAKFLTQETFSVHPVEMCVVRTVPNGSGGRDTYVRFSGKAEYEPSRGSNIVAEAVLTNNPVWITKEEYYNF